jgi:hypothetical protein
MDKTTTAETRMSFSTINSKHQLAWDSTSLGALKRCPRYYQYNIIEGHTTRKENANLRFGSEYNNALVIYNKARAKGDDHEAALLETVRYVLASTWDYNLGRPWTSEDPIKNRATLMRSVIWYLDRFENDTLETLILATGEPAVELPFRLHLHIDSALTGEAYLLCGYLDRLVVWEDRIYITDKKTTKHMLNEEYFKQYTPHTQMSQYSLAGTMICPTPIAGVIIDAAQVAVTFTRFQRGQVTRTRAQLEEWLADAVVSIRQNETYVQADHWPMNDQACDMYGGCPYRDVCSASPELRPKLLEGLFQRRSWDPLIVREI